jgi:hypothetical protein
MFSLYAFVIWLGCGLTVLGRQVINLGTTLTAHAFGRWL